MKALFARLRRTRPAAEQDIFDRRLGLLCARVPNRLPESGRSVFRMMA